MHGKCIFCPDSLIYDSTLKICRCPEGLWDPETQKCEKVCEDNEIMIDGKCECEGDLYKIHGKCSKCP